MHNPPSSIIRSPIGKAPGFKTFLFSNPMSIQLLFELILLKGFNLYIILSEPKFYRLNIHK